MRVVTCIVPFLGLGVLVSGAAAQTANRHPNPAYVTPAPRTVSVAFGTAQAIAQFVGREGLIGIIGSEDGPDATLFGRIGKATFLDDTTVAVLDQATPDVRLFSVTGRHLETIGRRGEGPGEFRAPQAVVRSPSGELLVSDARRNIQIFRRGPRGFEHHRTMQLPFGVHTMCFLGKRLFVNATTLDDSTILHQLDDDGTVRNSFGELYRSPNLSVNHQVGRGWIVCDPQRQLVYFMSGSLLGEVRAYRLSGELVWRVRVSDYRVNIVTDKSGGMEVAMSPLGVNGGVGFALIEGKGLFAMWTFRSPAQIEAKEGPTITHVVRIDPATGSATSLGQHPMVISDVRGTAQLQLSEEPFPRVEVRRAILP